MVFSTPKGIGTSSPTASTGLSRCKFQGMFHLHFFQPMLTYPDIRHLKRQSKQNLFVFGENSPCNRQASVKTEYHVRRLLELFFLGQFVCTARKYHTWSSFNSAHVPAFMNCLFLSLLFEWSFHCLPNHDGQSNLSGEFSRFYTYIPHMYVGIIWKVLISMFI